MRSTWLLVFFLLGACRGIPVYYDIGDVHRSVTAAEGSDAQLWFDRGLALSYGFNHEEAIRCFDRAIEADPACAMAFWGKAYALGPNYNNPVVSPEANDAAMQALAAAAKIEDKPSVEKDLLTAVAMRHASPAPDDRAALEAAYADAMRKLHAKYPDDADIAALTAEALMMLQPWKLWSADGTPATVTSEIRGVLEPALARWPEHPALCHLYIHTMEAGPEVAKALPVAKNLEQLMPGLGHMVHMPSHIYIWSGRYADSLRVNQAAVAKDRVYAEYAGRKNFYTLYRLHNYHFIAYSAMFTGQKKIALQAAHEIVKQIPADFLVDMADFLDIFVATPMHVMVRFGMWDEILRVPEPAAELLATRAVWRYARGIALASSGRVDEADREMARFLAAKDAVPETRMLFQNPVAKILEVAAAVLAGEIEYRKTNYDRAFALLRKAVELDLAMNYDEPWGWMEPARHALGALLTEQGKYDEAIEVYRANLARFPDNGWALHGLAECMRKTDREDEAATAEARFRKAWVHADVEIPGSCFCKTKS